MLLNCFQNTFQAQRLRSDAVRNISQHERTRTPAELRELIRLYSSEDYDAESDLLFSCVSETLTHMRAAKDKVPLMALAADIVELGRRQIIAVPSWTVGFLEEAVNQAREDRNVARAELVHPLLTLFFQTFSPALEREAEAIINDCHQRTLSSQGSPADLLISTTCSEYLPDFNTLPSNR